MKITDYPQATELASDDSFIIDGPTNGTRHIPKENLPWGEGGSGSVPATDPVWVSHRNTYRGKNLGTIFTEEQKAAIAAGTFDDLYIGDYWIIDNIATRIADINYFQTDTPHIVIVPDHPMGKASLQNITSYISSKIHTTELNNPKVVFESFFGTDHLMNHKRYLANSSNSTDVTGMVSSEMKLDNMSEEMVFGTHVFGANTFSDPCGRLALFEMKPNLIYTGFNENYWLSTMKRKDVLGFIWMNKEGDNSIAFCAIADTASYGGNVRPYCAIM